MRNSISRTLIAGLGALAMTAAFMLPGATGASAGFGFHVGVAGVRPMGGFGGFHGAPMGVHPGGFGGFGDVRGAGGVRPGAGFAAHSGAGVGAWHGALNSSNHEGGRWRAGYWRHGHWHNGWWGTAYSGCWASEPTYDAYGNYLGQQYVNVCDWPYGP